MSFASLPDDVLLEVFTSLEFHSIVALRQTCRRCWVLSKTTAVWLDPFRWLTRGSKDWRALLPDRPTSRPYKHLETLVARMVRFEINWNSGQPRQIRCFTVPPGFASRLVRGGRYFLCSAGYEKATVLYYDFDSKGTGDITRQVLIDYRKKSREIRAMDIAVDPLATPLEFDLALELASKDQFYEQTPTPREIMIWRVRLNENDELAATLTCSFDVFRPVRHSFPISFWGNFLLRASMGPSGVPVYVVHRWRGLEEGQVSHSVLLPDVAEDPEEGVRLLPDGRIISIFHDRVELHAPPEESWEEGPLIPKHTPRVAAQWVFKYTPSMYRYHRYVSDFIYYPTYNSAAFSVHNGESLFSFWIAANGDSLPEVTITPCGQMEEGEHIGLGTSHAIRNKPGSDEAIFMTFSQSNRISALRAFSGIASAVSSAKSGTFLPVIETSFTAPYPSGGGGWVVDEESARAVCTLQRKGEQYAVLYF